TFAAADQSASKGEGPVLMRMTKNAIRTASGIMAAGIQLTDDFFLGSGCLTGACVGDLSPSQSASASANAIAVGKRSSGFLDSACMQTDSMDLSSVDCAQAGDACDGGGMGSCTTRMRATIVISPGKGGFPVSIS